MLDSDHATLTPLPLLRIIDSTPVLVAYIDAQERYQFNNKTYEEWFGKSRTSLTGKHLKTLLGTKTYQIVRPYVRAALKGNKVTYESTVPYKEDETRDIQGVYIPDIAPSGKVRGFISVVRDITEQKRVEHVLQFLTEASRVLASSLDYKTTLRRVAHLAVPKIADWCVVTIAEPNSPNEQLALAHVDPKKLKLARELQRRYPSDPKQKRGIHQVMRTGKSEVLNDIPDQLLVAAAHDAHHLKLIRQLALKSYMIVPLKGTRRSLGAITFISAESGRKYGKQDLLMAEELASHAALAIENARLYTSATQALQDRETFLSIASHELKTPITSMKVYAQILGKLLRGNPDPKISQYLRKINDQVDKQTKLIEDLLNISKIQVGKFKFEVKEFDLWQLIVETVEALQATTDHRIVIQGKPAGKIKGDKDRIGQVIINLLTNAIKYSPDAQEIIVAVSATPRQATVAVRDFGIGIAKKNLKNIFNRFYQVGNSQQKTYPGLGIGLYVSAEIIERHHGRIWVTSRQGKGSTFSFSLPRPTAKKPIKHRRK